MKGTDVKSLGMRINAHESTVFTMLPTYHSSHVRGGGTDFGTKNVVCIHSNPRIYRIALAGVMIAF